MSQFQKNVIARSVATWQSLKLAQNARLFAEAHQVPRFARNDMSQFNSYDTTSNYPGSKIREILITGLYFPNNEEKNVFYVTTKIFIKIN